MQPCQIELTGKSFAHTGRSAPRGSADSHTVYTHTLIGNTQSLNAHKHIVAHTLVLDKVTWCTRSLEAVRSYWVTVILARRTKWSQLKRRGGCLCLMSSCRPPLSDPSSTQWHFLLWLLCFSTPSPPRQPEALIRKPAQAWLYWSKIISRAGNKHLPHSQSE